jgi:hypothetical protein
MSFKEPIPALSNVMDTKDNVYRLSFTGIRSLKTPGPGAVAHMSLHQKPTMSKSHQHKRRTTNRSPIYTGGPVVRSVLATEANRASRNRQGRVGEGPYMEGVESGQRLFAILFRGRDKPMKARRFLGGACSIWGVCTADQAPRSLPDLHGESRCSGSGPAEGISSRFAVNAHRACP